MKYNDVSVVTTTQNWTPRIYSLLNCVQSLTDNGRVGNSIRAIRTDIRFMVYTIVALGVSPDTYENNFRAIMFQDKQYTGGTSNLAYVAGTSEAMLAADSSQDVAITSPYFWPNTSRFVVKKDVVYACNPVTVETFHQFSVNWGGQAMEFDAATDTYPQRNLLLALYSSQNSAFIDFSFYARTYYTDA